MPTSEQQPPQPAARIIPPQKPRTLRDSLWTGLKWTLTALFLVYLIASFQRTEFNLYTLISGGKDIKRVMYDLAHPDFSWVERDAGGEVVLSRKTGQPKPGTVPVLLDEMNETVMMSLVGTLLSVLLSFPLSFLAARNLTKGSVSGQIAYNSVRFIFNVLRAFPPIILAIIFVFMVGPGPFPGVLALALHSIGMLGKLFSEAIESVDLAPVEAVRATGASNNLIVWFGILPQVLPQFVAFSLYRWDINIRMSIILGIVGAGGIGFLLDQYIRLFQYQKASTCFLIILVAVTILDWGSSWLRERMG
ncbi:phosphonate ABC transporter, permease protein PhnE [bacterium]|nr:phosphonate ABC transporter, permease protein PhnE [bacterium]